MTLSTLISDLMRHIRRRSIDRAVYTLPEIIDELKKPYWLDVGTAVTLSPDENEFSSEVLDLDGTIFRLNLIATEPNTTYTTQLTTGLIGQRVCIVIDRTISPSSSMVRITDRGVDLKNRDGEPLMEIRMGEPFSGYVILQWVRSQSAWIVEDYENCDLV